MRKVKRFRYNNLVISVVSCLLSAVPALARDVDYKGEEVRVWVTAGEPTQVQLPGNVSGGYKKANSMVELDKKEDSLIIFAKKGLPSTGEAILVRLEDGRSFSVRVEPATDENPRDAILKIQDDRGPMIAAEEEEEVPVKDKKFDYAPPTKVSGLIREMVLVSELGKQAIVGYKISDKYTGQKILSDGALEATIDKIFIGPNLWGYVINASNQLEQSQRLNPATFRLDGTRAVSFEKWELAPKPINIEQQISKGHQTKVYIVTRAKK